MRAVAGAWGGAFRLATSVRGAEWTLLAFLSYVGLRAALADRLVILEAVIPRYDIIAAVVTAAVLRAAAVYRRTSWGDAPTALRWLHWSMLPIFALPGAIVLLHDVLRLELLWPQPEFEQSVAVRGMNTIATTGIRVMMGSSPFLLFWLALGAHAKENGSVVLAAFARESTARVARSIRDWFPPVVLIWCYGLMGDVIALGFIPDADPTLARIDAALFFGHNPVQALESIVSRPLSEYMALSYTFYAPLFGICFAVFYALGDPRPFRELAFGVTLVLSIGYVGYTFVPAIGPVFTQTFTVDLSDYLLRAIREALMDRTRISRDCFPSLHTGASLVFLWACWRHVRRLFWILLPLVGAIPFACLYLRYHYVIDVLAGAALAFAVAWIVRRSSEARAGADEEAAA